MAAIDGIVEPLQRSSPILWLGAGAVGLVYASLYGMEAVMGTYPPVRPVLGPIMNIVAFTALLGLYPIFADRQPWLARAGGVCTVLAVVGSILAFGEAAGWVSAEAGWFLASQFLFIVFGMSLAFIAFAVASLRSEIFSRRVGPLLLIPALIMGLNLGIVIAGYASPEGRLLVSGLWAVTYLAIGITLRSAVGPGNSSTPTPDPTTR